MICHFVICLKKSSEIPKDFLLRFRTNEFWVKNHLWFPWDYYLLWDLEENYWKLPGSKKIRKSHWEFLGTSRGKITKRSRKIFLIFSFFLNSEISRKNIQIFYNPYLMSKYDDDASFWYLIFNPSFLLHKSKIPLTRINLILIDCKHNQKLINT